MKTRLRLAVLPVVLALPALPAPAFALEPIGDCPPGFHLHEVMDHHDGDGHRHVGTDADQNGDGWICAMHVSVDGAIHVHVDNNVMGS